MSELFQLLDDEVELTRKEYGQLKRALSEWKDLAGRYGANYVDEIEKAESGLNEHVEVTYQVPCFEDVIAAIQLLDARHNIDIGGSYAANYFTECKCGALVVVVDEKTECIGCGIVHNAESSE